jgi:hypothetical protein
VLVVVELFIVELDVDECELVQPVIPATAMAADIATADTIALIRWLGKIGKPNSHEYGFRRTRIEPPNAPFAQHSKFIKEAPLPIEQCLWKRGSGVLA